MTQCVLWRSVTSWLVATSLYGIALALICFPNTVKGQAQTGQPNGEATWQFRHDLFQMLFEQKGLRPIRDWKAAFAKPHQTVIVALGDIPPTNKSFEVFRFLSRGGAILAASDRTTSFRADFSISSGPVLASSDSDKYQGHNDCIRIKNLHKSHPLTEGVTELIANRAGCIRPRWPARSAWQVIARFPNSTGVQSRSKPMIAAFDRKDSNGSKFVAVSDHSLFTNGMIWHGDNARFAINVANFLCDDSRTQVLFLVDRSASSSYLVGPLASELPFPDVDATPDLDVSQMLAVANSVIAHVQDTDVLNELAAKRPRTLHDPIYRRLLWNALALALIIIVVRKLARRGRRQATPVGSILPTVAGNTLGKPKNDPRMHGQAAATLARSFLRELTKSTDPTVWKRFFAPESIQSRGIDLPQKSKAQLAHVMSLALDGKPKTMASPKLVRTSQVISELRRRLSEPVTGN